VRAGLFYFEIPEVRNVLGDDIRHVKKKSEWTSHK